MKKAILPIILFISLLVLAWFDRPRKSEALKYCAEIKDITQKSQTEALLDLKNIIMLSWELELALSKTDISEETKNKLNSLRTLLSKAETDHDKTHRATLSERDSIYSLIIQIEDTLRSTDSPIEQVPKGLTSLLKSWPFVLLIILFIMSSGGLFTELVHRVTSLKLSSGSLEMNLTEQTARNIENSIHDIMRSYREQVNREYRRRVRQHMIVEKHEILCRKLRPILGDSANTTRFTVHVPDVLIAESLYQLVHYYPRGKGAGRIKSTGFGLIGRVWRSRKSLVYGRIPPDRDQLIGEWGMTRAQADTAGNERQSFAGIILRTARDEEVGVFYMDNKDEYAFGETDGTALQDQKSKEIINLVQENGRILADAIENLQKEVRAIGPKLKIFE